MDSEAWKAWAAPANLPRMLAGSAMRRAALLHRGDRLAEGHPGGQVERERHGREEALVVHLQRGRARLEAGERGEGDGLAALRLDVDVAEGVGALPELGRHLHHHPVLVELGVDGRHLALPEGAVERLVDEPRAHPEPGRGVPIDGERHLQPRVLLVARDVAQLGEARAGSGACAGPTRSDPPDGRPAACTGTARCPCARPAGCPAPPGDSRWPRRRARASGAAG